MKTISVDELKELIDNQADFQLIDVREPFEYESANIGGELIPLQTVPTHVDKIDKNTGEWTDVWVSDMRGVDNPIVTMASTGQHGQCPFEGRCRI